VPSLSAAIDAVHESAAELLAAGATPGVAVALVRDGDLVWSAGFGAADPFTGRPATARTLFRIASVTKPFTATAVLALRDEGRLALHDPLAAYVPEVRAIRDPFGSIERLTVGQVLLHTAGLQTDAPTDTGATPGLTQAQLLGRLGEAALVHPPDTRWHYSNLGYELLAILVARLAGRPYAEHLQATVLDPAGLADTTYHPRPEHEDRLAVGATRDPAEPGWSHAPDTDPDHHLGDGGLWSTVDDLARWIGVQCHVADEDRRGDGPRVLDGPSLRELQRPLALVDLDGWRSAQGPGWASFRVDEDAWVGHTGSLPGFLALLLFRPAERIGAVALANGTDRPTEVVHAACRALLAEHRAAAGTASPGAVAATPR
jgi:CubicO group peptidase (beta-lactamase class C family)